MNNFFLTVEIFLYALGVFLFFKKRERGLFYIPVLVFCNMLIVPVFPAFLYYSTISALILLAVIKFPGFYHNNIFAIVLFLYFIVLIPFSSNLELIRPNLFSLLWLFVSVPLIFEIYRNTDEEVIFHEVANAALIILVLFVLNVGVSTIFKYSPNGMYGITKGIVYGNLYGAGFNILAIAIFVTFLRILQRKEYFTIVVLILTYAFLMLSLRRSVMLVASIGIGVALLALLTQKEARKFILFGLVIFLLGFAVYSSTSFMDQFNDRYELRNLDTRELEGEARFLEYELVYKDMFVYNEYSPWTGYELLNSSGNYGHKIFESRTLHADLSSIAHSSGIIGLCLYLLMVAQTFRRSLQSASTSLDHLILLFAGIAFVVYTITGRFTEAGSMLLLFLVIMLPLAKSDNGSEPETCNDYIHE